jgi:predicted RNA-binding Zn ribbon-like protein
MNDDEKLLNVELDNLYKRHKQNTQVPRHIKRQVMAAANRADYSKPRSWKNTHWLSAIATVAVFAVLVNMFIVRKDMVDLLDTAALGEHKRDFVVDVVHRLESESRATVAQNERQQQLEKIYHDYQKRKVVLAAHHQQAAQLVAVSDGWSLKTCDDELVQISPQLVSLFVDWEQIETDIALGDQVDITFDSQGRIAKIRRVTEAMQC